MNNGMQQQAYHIDHDVALIAFDLFARIKAVWINAGPLFKRSSRFGCRSHRPSDLPLGPSLIPSLSVGHERIR
jgi:hypothetical protein